MTFPFLELATVNAPFMEEIQKRVAGVIASGRYVGGPEIDEFEENLARLTGARFAVGVSNGLDALRLILRAYLHRPGAGDFRRRTRTRTCRALGRHLKSRS